MQVALARHDVVLRLVIEEFGGFVFSTAGDAFSAAFHTAAAAVSAAVEAQRRLQAEPWPDQAVLRVRMGVHVGSVVERGGDYFGSVVNRAARLMDLAHGGQVVASLAVEELVRDNLPGGVSLVPLGDHELRGLSRPETVFELRVEGLLVGFPPLRSAASEPGNLPTPLTTFVGRVEQIKHLSVMVRGRALVTLVGPGGVGKTRLSIEVASAARDEFTDGVWFVELAPLASPDAVDHAVAGALMLTAEAGSTLLDSIAEGLSGRRLLLVLDNCEHVLSAVSALVAAVGRRAPTVSVLATSRAPLAVIGEQVWPVSPLDPALEAVELFVDRARAADPEFELSDAGVDELVGLCARLDGIPLAVELAAARARSLSISDLADRLADRFKLLRNTRRTTGGDERQQTLRATVEWSYRLLGQAEQLLFDRLSVFAGSFDHAAAETVCADEDLDEADVADLVECLVDHSMVQVRRSGDLVRLQLLETLRQYGTERLAERGATAEVADRHLAYYVRLALRAQDWFEGRRCTAGRELFVREWDNLRAALEHAEATGAETSANQLVCAAFWYAWNTANDEHERWARRRVQSLTRPDSAVLACAAPWANVTGDIDRQGELGRLSVDAAPSPDAPAAAFGWWNVCAAAWYDGQPDEAFVADAAAKQAASRGPVNLTNVFILGWAHPTAAVNAAHAPAVVAQARALAADLGNDAIDAVLAAHAGIAAWAVGDKETAFNEWRYAADLGATAQMRNIEAAALGFLTIRAAAAPDTDTARLFRDTLARVRELRLIGYQFWVLAGLADWWAIDPERRHDAARLLGFLDHRNPHGNQSVADLRQRAAQVVDANPDALIHRAHGASMTLNQIIEHCLNLLDRPTSGTDIS